MVLMRIVAMILTLGLAAMGGAAPSGPPIRIGGTLALTGDDLIKLKQVQDGKWVVVWPREFAPPGVRLLP